MYPFANSSATNTFFSLTNHKPVNLFETWLKSSISTANFGPCTAANSYPTCMYKSTRNSIRQQKTDSQEYKESCSRSEFLAVFFCHVCHAKIYQWDIQEKTLSHPMPLVVKGPKSNFMINDTTKIMCIYNSKWSLIIHIIFISSSNSSSTRSSNSSSSSISSSSSSSSSSNSSQKTVWASWPWLAPQLLFLKKLRGFDSLPGLLALPGCTSPTQNSSVATCEFGDPQKSMAVAKGWLKVKRTNQKSWTNLTACCETWALWNMWKCLMNLWMMSWSLLNSADRRLLWTKKNKRCCQKFIIVNVYASDMLQLRKLLKEKR